MLEEKEKSCILAGELVGVNVGLACFDGIIAILAFTQLARIHSRNSQLGWTRQKVFHLLIGSTNAGYFVYFVLTLVAACRGWLCWSYSCGFVAMAFPRILFFATFLLLLSFWVDLCHQADDEEEEDVEQGFLEALLQNSLNRPRSSIADGYRICYPFRLIHIGSRQKVVILVTVLVFLFMMTFSVLIWIRMEDNPIDSSTVARVYVDLFAVAILLLGGALACYGLAIVSVLCFTSSAFVALFTDIPVLYHWHELHINGVYTSLLLILYYFIGSSVPSAFVLWVMRELPPMSIANIPGESTTITFITDSSAEVHHPQGWTTAASSQNQVHISFCLYIRFIQNLLIHVYFCSLCQPDLSNFTCFYMRYMVFLSLPTCIGNVVASYYLHIRYTSESCSDLVRDWLVQILPKRQFHSLIIEN
ncbi:tobamovirus multiplication protein 1-like isoform X5 [Durio zibethinus]|uniref:Tobamovirus multiplication protein 1-like isoform X5 n=1 Tax=Durio zibethinus TaxID=66656 RepID=A0A6P5WHY8_DURZI|nr:tobamovirus multiplication protein 1-like isoform X5 [Durio zibethinus]